MKSFLKVFIDYYIQSYSNVHEKFLNSDPWKFIIQGEC